MSVTVTITGVTVEPGSGHAGRRLSEKASRGAKTQTTDRFMLVTPNLDHGTGHSGGRL